MVMFMVHILQLSLSALSLQTVVATLFTSFGVNLTNSAWTAFCQGPLVTIVFSSMRFFNLQSQNELGHEVKNLVEKLVEGNRLLDKKFEEKLDSMEGNIKSLKTKFEEKLDAIKSATLEEKMTSVDENLKFAMSYVQQRSVMLSKDEYRKLKMAENLQKRIKKVLKQFDKEENILLKKWILSSEARGFRALSGNNMGKSSCFKVKRRFKLEIKSEAIDSFRRLS